jgi:hypothetical protein
MSRRKQLPFVMTLRMDRQLAADLEDIALSLSASKAAFIRRSLRLAVQNARRAVSSDGEGHQPDERSLQ